MVNQHITLVPSKMRGLWYLHLLKSEWAEYLLRMSCTQLTEGGDDNLTH
jgi:hypothetical protein